MFWCRGIGSFSTREVCSHVLGSVRCGSVFGEMTDENSFFPVFALGSCGSQEMIDAVLNLLAVGLSCGTKPSLIIQVISFSYMLASTW